MIPTVFISYSHDSPAHKEWVLRLATALSSGGVDVSIDQWDLRPGQDVGRFMETAIAKSDRVIVVCSAKYVEKANAGRGGVGYEKTVITSELLGDQNTTKFLPIVRNNLSPAKTPACLASRLYIDFSVDNEYDASFGRLLRDLHGLPPSDRPALGGSPFAADQGFRPGMDVPTPTAKMVRAFGLSPTSLVGATIAGCTLSGVVGSGGFGFVFQGTRASLGHDVALKISYPLPQDFNYSMRSSFEARCLEQKLLTHPNIARVYASGTCDLQGSERLFVLSDFVGGVTLRHFCGPFVDADHANRTGRLFCELCEALAYAHSVASNEVFIYGHSRRGLIHGDIKPGNVIVTNDHHAKLVDFDLINFDWLLGFGTLDQQDGYHWVTAGGGANVFGTPGYMAPELIDGEELTVVSDVYALGMTLYELCTGEKLPVIRALNMHGGTLEQSQIDLLLTLAGPFVPSWVGPCLGVTLQNDPSRRAESVSDLISLLPARSNGGFKESRARAK